ncbi:hypothetical protein NP493_195g03014 [Ridgeia piscesae]|uniref:SOCS box domain-containing protein n=1 Tax=Ridgeia piscesae TaxID=27915 RepID=A0AAD9UEN8_RIDPI|nr:hypothetical protein NP493_195g03014 [Ridgeia piscesae]
MNWLRGKLSRKHRRKPENSEFARVWQSHCFDATPDQQLVRDVGSELREKIAAKSVDPAGVAKDVVRFVIGCTDDTKRDVNRMLILELIDILASFRPDDRDTVRLVLGALYSVRRIVDREAFLFDHVDSGELDDVTRRKTDYMLRAVAGWRLPAHEPWTPGAGRYFLDLPMTTAKGAVGTTQPTLIYQALYHLQDAQLVLDVLRCGVHPSCFYLWAVCMHIDFCLLWQRNGVDRQLVTDTTLLRYFCRARHYMHPHVIRNGADVFIGQLLQRAGDIDIDDLLLLTADVQRFLPPDRYIHASSLKHQCRLVIRHALLLSDNLPRGIEFLQLPPLVKDYVDLLYD